jgi:DNA-binding MarR family transcriptional regulator
MVKRLDDIKADLIDHVGWRIWRLARAWKAEFDAAMAARGHHWFAEARSNVLSHLDRDSTAQSVLQARMGVTKQAVQQFVDELVADGILQRRTNPDDRRGKILSFTRKGQRVLADANIVKVEIQSRYRTKLGVPRFAAFMAALELLEGNEAAPPSAAAGGPAR